MKKKAIIIGAGPAGLTAAYYLLKKTDIKPIILEETEYIGGISRTAEYKGNRIDLGGHRFFSKSDEVNNLWTQILPLQGAPSHDDKVLGIDKPMSIGGPDPEKTDRVMLIRNRVSRILFLRKFFDYPISLKWATFRNMGFAKTCKSGFGYIKSCLFKKKEDSLENFYINRFGEPLYEMFFKEYTTKLWGRSPSEISADWGAQRVKGVSVISVICNAITKPFRSKEAKETSLIEQYYYPKLGPGQLWEALADEIRSLGGEIIFNSKVDKITVENGNITSVSAGETAYTADHFFSTMPVKDLISAMGDVPNEEVKRVAAGLPYRDFMTVGLLCDKLKLKNNTNKKSSSDIIPDCWIYVQEPDAVVGRIQVFNNWSPYMVADPANTVWIGLEYFCKEGDNYWSMSDDEFIKFAIDELVRLDIIERDAIKDSLRIKVKKAYPAYFDTYSQFDTVKDYLNGIENLWCLGRNGQHRYNNMDHSMLTAIEAVDAIVSGSSSKESVWNVNTEKDYHETKQEKKKEPSAPKSGKSYWSKIGSIFLILGAILSVAYFIIFPSRGVYTSDCYDSLMWANATYESHKIFTERFSYAALLPFGAQLWMTPLIAIFGLTMKTQLISMVIFMFIFAASVIFLCRSLKWSVPWCSVALFSVMLILSSSRYLLQLMWCHVIYYSIGLTLLFLCLGVAVRLCRYNWDKIKQYPLKTAILSAALFLLSTGAATDGFQIIALSLIPVVGAVVISMMLNEGKLLSKDNTGAYISIAVTVIGVVAGTFILNKLKGDIVAGYADAFSYYSGLGEWSENAQRFMSRYVSLLGVSVRDEMSLAEFDSVINIIRLATGILLLILPVVGLLSFGSKGDKTTRMAIIAHFINSAVIMFVFVCGVVSTSNWRLLPMVGTAIFASIATIRWISLNFKPNFKRFTTLSLVIILLCSSISATEMLSMDKDYGKDNAFYQLAEELEKRDLTYGYATFWNASTVTMASDSTVKVRNIKIENDAIVQYQYQSMDYWFRDQKGQKEYFVALKHDEYKKIENTNYWKNLMSENYIDQFDCGDYRVTVFDSNIFVYG